MMSNKKRKLKKIRANYNRLIETEGNRIRKLEKLSELNKLNKEEKDEFIRYRAKA